MLSSAAGPHRPASTFPIVRFVGAARRDVRTLRGLSVRVITVFAVVVATVSIVARDARDARAASADQMDGLFRSLSPLGWIAADGGYSVSLSGGRTAWVFGDTLTSRSGGTSPRLVPNSIVVTGARPPRVFLEPLPSARDGFFYWPADGHVASGSQIWLLCLQTISDSTGIHILGNYLARLDVNNGRLVSLRALPAGPTVQWGSDLFDFGGYTYIYGTEPMSSASAAYWLHVARVPTSRLDTAWRYFTGKGWSSAPAASARVLARVSFSPAVVKLGCTRLTLVSQDVLFGRTMYAWQAATPTGPFTRKRAVGVIPSVAPRTFSYLAHPHPDSLIGSATMFSFSTNTFDKLSQSDFITVYQPRFFTLSNRMLSGAYQCKR
jgi:hypothetical protein